LPHQHAIQGLNMQTGKLNGKVALVVGAYSGIGKATALAPAAEGARAWRPSRDVCGA
jgi:NADP-dependent 3-hydroxy acid dehydrogenase YdfG